MILLRFLPLFRFLLSHTVDGNTSKTADGESDEEEAEVKEVKMIKIPVRVAHTSVQLDVPDESEAFVSESQVGSKAHMSIG